MSFAVGPNDLKQKPTTTPNKMPTMTWKFRLVKSFFMQNKYTLIRQINKGIIGYPKPIKHNQLMLM